MTGLHGQLWQSGFFERSHDGIYMADMQGNLLAVNPAYAEFVGYSEEELMGMNVMQMVAPEDLEHAGAVMTNLLRDGIVEPFEVAVRCKDGSIVWAEISARIAETDAGPRHIPRESFERPRSVTSWRKSYATRQ